MARKGYMVCESTNLIGCVCYSLQADEDIENGAIVGKGDLVEGETQIYEATDDLSGKVYLVCNPHYSYYDFPTAQNEENFTNKAGKPFRVYELKEDKKFKIYNLPDEVELEEGDYVEWSDGKWAVADGDTNFVCEKVEEVGFPYCIGEAGTYSEDWGSAVAGQPMKKYTIRVVA